jgi:NADPH:quinone reductase-like Zn-dependent oxidoreductase
MLTEIVLPGVVDADGLLVQRRPVPAPARGEARVRTDVSAVSFAEGSMRRARYPGQPKFPFVPGYDLVGVVEAVGAGVDRALIGRRVAAVVKTGGWTTHALLDARDLVPISAELDPAEVETVLLNGVTAWQMLHGTARVRAGQTILVHGASGGVGTLLVQLARDAGIRVIGTGSPRSHAALQELGAETLDYHDADLADQVRALAPAGVDAVFDNLGGDSFARSFGLLGPGGTLVGYGTASQREDSHSLLLTFAAILGRFSLWSALPNGGRSARFYNFWGGKATRPRRFRARLAADLHAVLDLLAQGAITAHVGARLPLADAGRALAMADSRAVYGKILLLA